ncbi:helix-turn-helix domain-containing protein [Streptomyces sp. NPDC005151]
MLRSTQQPVSAIAHEVGCTSEAAFSRRFGTPPSQWRRAS